MMYVYEVEGNFRIEFGDVKMQGTTKLNAVERRFFHGVLTIVIVIVKSCWVPGFC